MALIPEKLPRDFFLEALAKQQSEKYTNESRNVGNKIENFGDTDHALDANKLDAIKQKNSKGFTVFDINPNNLSRDNYPCVYSGDTIGRILGYDYTMLFNADTLDSVTNQDGIFGYAPFPYWRSVEINKPGNWIKIEYLDARFNNQGFVNSPQPQNNISDTPQNTNIDYSSWEYEGNIIQTSAQQKILLDFENASPSPFVVKSGDTFETYFSSVVITFKQLSPLIRITIGYNSKVVERSNTTNSLHLGNGHGYADQMHNLTPFCFSDRDFTQTPYYSNSYAGIYCNGTTTMYYPLVINPLLARSGRTYSHGLSMFYITDFKGFVYNTASTATAEDLWDCELVIGKYDNSSTSMQPTLPLTKRIIGETYYNRFASSEPVFSSQGVTNLAEPIRVMLRPGEAIYLRITPSSVTNTSSLFKFFINGYGAPMILQTTFFGQTISSSGLSVGRCAFFLPTNFFTENPFPVDTGSYDMPRR